MKKTILLVKVLVISVLCSVIMMFLHKSTILNSIEANGLSWLANQVGAETAAFLWGIAAYCVVSLVFISTEKVLKGSNTKKALLFGGLTGSTWWLGMIEIDQTLNNVIMGLVDGFMVVLVCIMTALFVLPKHEIVDETDFAKEKIKNNIVEILIVATIFAFSRLFFGLFLGKYYNSSFDYLLIPVYSVFMGFMWVKLKGIKERGRHLTKALNYGVVTWGLPSCIFMYFLAFLFKNMFVGMTIRNISDVFFMTLAVWLTMKFRMNRKE